jgi:hypothetical protein
VPTQLRAVIERCLEKEADRRYQQAGELRVALEAIQARLPDYEIDAAKLVRVHSPNVRGFASMPITFTPRC